MTLPNTLSLGHSLIDPRTFNRLFESFDYNLLSSDYPLNYYTNSETGTQVLEYALAGFTKDEIKIDVKRDRVIITAKKEESKDNSLRVYAKQGIAQRSMKATWKVDASKVDLANLKATFKNGLLKVEFLPSKEETESSFSVTIS